MVAIGGNESYFERKLVGHSCHVHSVSLAIPGELRLTQQLPVAQPASSTRQPPVLVPLDNFYLTVLSHICDNSWRGLMLGDHSKAMLLIFIY